MYETGPELQTSGYVADSFEELADLAIGHIGKRRKLHIVCGPITTGGTGNQRYNFMVFQATIAGLARRGYDVFDQTPYEFGLRRLAWKWEQDGNTGYCTPILEVFYHRIFETRAFGDGWFIPGSRTSVGARSEHDKLLRFGAGLHHLMKCEVRQFLQEAGHPPELVEDILRLMPEF